jgi:hypothetical protein
MNSAGTLLRLFQGTCHETSSVFIGSNGCLIKDGNIGVLWPEEGFVTLTEHGRGDRLFAVTGERQTSYPFQAVCAGPCKVQQIDPAARLIIGERRHELPLRRVVAARHDDTCDMLLIAYERSGDAGGFRLQLLEHGGP